MNRTVLTAATLFALVACDTPAEPQPMESCEVDLAEGRTGLTVDATVLFPLLGEDGSVQECHSEVAECATVTVTCDELPDWQLRTTAGSELALAPGTYRLQASWEIEGVTYHSRERTVGVGAQGWTSAEVSLCADLTGSWTCTDDTGTWTEQVASAATCEATLPELGLTLQSFGHLLYGPDTFGELSRDGSELYLQDGTTETTCWRD